MSELKVRTATEADVPALLTLVTSAYRGDASREGWTTEADLLTGSRIDADLLLADLRRPRSVVLVAEDADQENAAGPLHGCVHLQQISSPGAAMARSYLGMFAVSPRAQGAGLGSQILAAAEHHVVGAWNASEMEMTVIEQRHELIAFYQRRGYLPTGELRDFPYGDERFGTPLRTDLQMVVLVKKLISPTQPAGGY